MSTTSTEQKMDYDRLGSMARSALLNIMFQPKVNLKTGHLCGVETLSRWRKDHPQPPWLLAQTGTGLVDLEMYCEAYDYTVLSTVFDRCSRWTPDIRTTIREVAVNVTGPTLCSAWLAPLIKRCLSTRGLPRLTIELTETFAITSEVSALKTMKALAPYGVSFSIDDFLTGFNQQMIFARLPFQELKIDRKNTQNLSSETGRASLAEIVTSASVRDVVVVAEGIEHPDQFEQAKILGCDQGQGHCISHPLSESDLLTRIASAGTRPWSMYFDNKITAEPEH